MKTRRLVGIALMIALIILQNNTAFAYSTSLTDLPLGYYSSVGYTSDKVEDRVEGWLSYSEEGDYLLSFAHYALEGSMYSFYDETSPNGDYLLLYESNGKTYGYSFNDGNTYNVILNGSTIQIEWRCVPWYSTSVITIGSSTSKSGYNTTPDDGSSGNGGGIFDVYVGVG